MQYIIYQLAEYNRNAESNNYVPITSNIIAKSVNDWMTNLEYLYGRQWPDICNIAGKGLND